MALKHILIIGALLISFVASGVADGQLNTPSPRFRYKDVETADSTRPFATPGVFDYDAQMFAPLEFTDGQEKQPNTGFFFTLDKIYTSVGRASQPDNVNSDMVQTGSNYIWGTRYELGWFTDDDDGWLVSYQYADGIYFTAGQDVSVPNPMLVDMNVSTFEFNRMFRQSLSRGGYFEPYMGIRFMHIRDKTLEDTVQLVNATNVGNRFKQSATNDAFGIQAGGRYNLRHGRWRTTWDGALATTYNQQRYFATDISSAGATQGISETYQNDQSFVPILDGEFELAYNISRDISLRYGIQAIYSWDGIARANTLTTNVNPNSIFGTGGGPVGLFDTSHISAGFLFGVEWRR